MKKILVVVKEKYGNERIYPCCPTSELLLQLLPKRKSFTADQMVVLKKLGYEISLVEKKRSF